MELVGFVVLATVILVLISWYDHLPSFDSAGKALARISIFSMLCLGLYAFGNGADWQETRHVVTTPGVMLTFWGATGLLAYFYDRQIQRQVLPQNPSDDDDNEVETMVDADYASLTPTRPRKRKRT